MASWLEWLCLCALSKMLWVSCHGKMYYRRMPSITLSVNGDGKPGIAAWRQIAFVALLLLLLLQTSQGLLMLSSVTLYCGVPWWLKSVSYIIKVSSQSSQKPPFILHFPPKTGLITLKLIASVLCECSHFFHSPLNYIQHCLNTQRLILATNSIGMKIECDFLG